MAVPVRRVARPGGAPGAAGRESTYRELAPPAALAPALACTWEGRPGWPRPLRLVPDGGTDLVWDGRALLVARPVAGPVRHFVDGDADRAGARLRPGWAAAVLGRPVDALPPLVAARDLWGPAVAGPAEDALGAAATPAAHRALLARLVVARLAAAGPAPGSGRAVDRQVVAAARRLARPGASVAETADAVGLSVRQLRRRVEHHVGVGPKALQRILRFQRFLAGAAGPHPWRTAAEAAAACGYADQSHLALDCRRLAGATPRSLMAPPSLSSAARRAPSPRSGAAPGGGGRSRRRPAGTGARR